MNEILISNGYNTGTGSFKRLPNGTEGQQLVLGETGPVWETPATLAHGTYTPTLDNTVNVTSSVARLCTYMRVGNVVTVSGQFTITPSSAAAVVLGISLPIATTFTTIYQAGGVASSIDVIGQTGGIQSLSTRSTVEVRFIADDLTERVMAFTFTYRIQA